MRKYDPKKFPESKKFVLSPNFEVRTEIKNGIERKTLIIFDEIDRKLCYTYYHCKSYDIFYCNGCLCKKKRISASIFQNSDGEDYVILSNMKHVCSLQTYVPKQKEIILRHPAIKFMESNESNKSKLYIFDSNDSKLCHTFSRFGESKKYNCLGCKQKLKDEKKKINWNQLYTVYLFKDETLNGEYFVKMLDDQKHICKPQKYEPEKYETVKLNPKTDYFLIRSNALSLVIYHSEDKNRCYKFNYNKRVKTFHCSACKKNRKFISAKIDQDSDGNEYITTNKAKHVCTPIKCSSIIKSDTVILDKSDLVFEKTMKEINENRIVRLPNYQLQRNKFGVPDRRLIILTEDNQTLCYEYEYNSERFICKKCKISAKLNIDAENGEKYIILSKNQHKCEPVEYESEKKKLETSNFMEFNINDKNKLAKLIIFTSSEKDLCYEYSFIKRQNCYQCCACFSLKKIVTAQIKKDENGKEYIQRFKSDHICSPKKFILEEFQPKIVPECDFKLVPNQKGKPNSNLIIFDSEKDGFVYDYYLKDKNLFACNQCQKKKKRVTAKLYEKENGEKYFELSSIQHICKSRPEHLKKRIS